jgi:hypothetical protein
MKQPIRQKGQICSGNFYAIGSFRRLKLYQGLRLKTDLLPTTVLPSHRPKFVTLESPELASFSGRRILRPEPLFALRAVASEPGPENKYGFFNFSRLSFQCIYIQGNLIEGEGLSTVHLLIKLACLIKKISINRS